jgi:hypothetical protein
MGLFSMAVKDGNYFNDDCGFIELVSCPGGGELCSEHLNFINERMKLSRTYWVNKEFPQAIEELKIAFNKTAELNSPTCLPCVELFRSTIIKSLEVRQKEFRTRKGFIKRKSYSPDYELATAMLVGFAK